MSFLSTYLELITSINKDENYKLFSQLCDQLAYVVLEKFVEDIENTLLKYKNKKHLFNINHFNNYVHCLSNSYLSSFHDGLWYYLKSVGPYENRMRQYINDYISVNDQRKMTETEKIRMFEQSNCFQNEILDLKEQMKEIVSYVLATKIFSKV